MSWLIFAFSGPVLWALSTHLDKYLVDRFFKNSDIAVLLVFTALIGIVTLPFIGAFVPAVLFVSGGAMALMALSGVLYIAALFFYLRALQTEEASTVAPLFQMGPLIGYVLGYFILGEVLTGAQMTGGALIVGGTLLVSIRTGKHTPRFKARIAGLMLTSATFMALSSLLFKIFALRDEFWTTTFWMFVGEGVFGVALLAHSPYRRQFVALMRLQTGAVLAINGANELINLGGGLGNRYALMLAPLSIVQAIGSTTTLFVFSFGVMLSLCLPAYSRESIAARELIQKGGAALLVAAGVVLVSRN